MRGEVAFEERGRADFPPRGTGGPMGLVGSLFASEMNEAVQVMVRCSREQRERYNRELEKLAALKKMDGRTRRECRIRRKRAEKIQLAMTCLPLVVSSLFFLLTMSPGAAWVQGCAAGASVCSALGVSAGGYFFEKNSCHSEGRHTLVKGELQDSFQRCREILNQLEGGEGRFFQLKLLFSFSRGVNRVGDSASNADS